MINIVEIRRLVVSVLEYCSGEDKNNIKYESNVIGFAVKELNFMFTLL